MVHYRQKIEGRREQQMKKRTCSNFSNLVFVLFDSAQEYKNEAEPEGSVVCVFLVTMESQQTLRFSWYLV